jgi:hypothetical protein
MRRRTSIILVAVATTVLGGTLIASAQVSSCSPEAAQQNFAKKPTDKPVQSDQQNATDKPVQNDQQRMPPLTVGRRFPRAGDEADGVHGVAPRKLWQRNASRASLHSARNESARLGHLPLENVSTTRADRLAAILVKDHGNCRAVARRAACGVI